MKASASSSSSPEAAYAVAALRDGGRATTVGARRPVRLKLDAGTYDDLTVELPSPALLADVWATPFVTASLDVFSDGTTLLTRPAGSDVTPAPASIPSMIDALRDGLAGLPERDDAGRPYKDLRLFVTVADAATAGGYLAEVVRRVRMAAPKWSPPKVDRPAKPAAERAADSRASRKATRGRVITHLRSTQTSTCCAPCGRGRRGSWSSPPRRRS